MDSGGAPQRIDGCHFSDEGDNLGVHGRRPTVGRPESLAQCSRKRRRCQRSTVSGATMMRACAHVRAIQIQNHRSLLRSFGRGVVRL